MYSLGQSTKLKKSQNYYMGTSLVQLLNHHVNDDLFRKPFVKKNQQDLGWSSYPLLVVEKF